MKCRYPILIQDDVRGCSYYVPCGKCAWCRSRLRNEWFFRFKIEQLGVECCRFVTLTYDDAYLPCLIDQDSGLMVPSVCPDHITKFTRALHNSSKKFRYFIASEYGSIHGRPHYHMLSWSHQEIDFQEFWPRGNVFDVPQNDGSLKYTTKYLLKGSNVPDGALPNFRRMSRRPGIGAAFTYKGERYLRTADGVIPVGHYYRRRYLNSLNEKIAAFEKDLTVDFLKDRSQFEDLEKDFRDANTGETFEEWISRIYKKDYVKQLNINKK